MAGGGASKRTVLRLFPTARWLATALGWPMSQVAEKPANAYEPKEPPLVKGKGAIAFGGGAVLTQAGRDYLREVDSIQLDGEAPAPAADPVEPAVAA